MACNINLRLLLPFYLCRKDGDELALSYLSYSGSLDCVNKSVCSGAFFGWYETNKLDFSFGKKTIQHKTLSTIYCIVSEEIIVHAFIGSRCVPEQLVSFLFI